MSNNPKTGFLLFCREFTSPFFLPHERIEKSYLHKQWNALSEMHRNEYRMRAGQKTKNTFNYSLFLPKNYIPWDGIIRTMYQDYPNEVPEKLQEYRKSLLPLEEAKTSAQLMTAFLEARFTKEDLDNIASTTLDWINAGNMSHYLSHLRLTHMAKKVSNENQLLFLCKFFHEFTNKDHYEVTALSNFVIQAIQYDRKLFEALYRFYGVFEEEHLDTMEEFSLIGTACLLHYVRKNDLDTVQYLLQFSYNKIEFFSEVLKENLTVEMREILFNTEMNETAVNRALDTFSSIGEPSIMCRENLSSFIHNIKEKYHDIVASHFTFLLQNEHVRNRLIVLQMFLQENISLDFSKLSCLHFLECKSPLQVEHHGKKYEIRMVEKKE